MNGQRQVEIPPAVPGELIGQTLLNSLIGAANNARQITGDGGINVSNVGGVMGLSLDLKRPGKQTFLIQVQATPVIAPGFYYGKIYSQTALNFTSTIAGTTTTPLSPVPIPNAVTCLVVNIAEVNAATYGTSGTYAAAPRQITANRMAFGQFVGYMDTTNIVPALPAGPLFAIDVGSVGIAPGTITASSGGPVQWNYSGMTYTGVALTIVRNDMEPVNGSPGKLGITISSAGTTSSGCTVKAIGVGAGVLFYPDPTVPGGFMFSEPNSAEP